MISNTTIYIHAYFKSIFKISDSTAIFQSKQWQSISAFPFLIFSVLYALYTQNRDKNCLGIQSWRHDTESRVSRSKICYWKWFLNYTAVRQEMKNKIFSYKIVTLRSFVHVEFHVAKNKVLSVFACFEDNIKGFILVLLSGI